VLAVNSAFRKLKNRYARIVPIFEDFGFTPPSAGVNARDLSGEDRDTRLQNLARSAEVQPRRARL
jgi:hypothetical protein